MFDNSDNPFEDERVTPHSLDAERAVLGAILVDGARFLDVAGELSHVDFFRVPHQHIYSAMRDLATAGQPVDALILAETLATRGKLGEVGGRAYLFGLTDGVPFGVNIEAYAQIVRDKATIRRLVAAGTKIAGDAASEHGSAVELLDAAERAIFSVSDRSIRGDFVDAQTLVTEGYPVIAALMENKSGVTGTATGFDELDGMTRGLQPGTLVLVAARPSMGKSALASCIAWNVASRGETVGFFSLEMSKQELLMRLVASVADVDGHRLQSGWVDQTDYSRLADAFGRISASKLHIDDTGTVGVLDVRGKSRRLKMREGLSLVVVDYLQLMQVAKAENRNQAIADISRSLKLLSKELGVPVLALSQLSRETEKRSEKRPMLSDLRDSGALEQDADVVLFIHRPEVYDPRPENKGVAEIIIAKNRTGPIGSVELKWDARSTRFDNR